MRYIIINFYKYIYYILFCTIIGCYIGMGNIFIFTMQDFITYNDKFLNKAIIINRLMLPKKLHLYLHTSLNITS